MAGRRLISSCSRRLRSASSPAQNDLDDVELIDEFSSSGSALGSMIRNRGRGEKRLPQLRPMSAQEERRAQERDKNARKLAEKQALDKFIAACCRVQSEVAKFDQKLQDNVEIYLNAKYATIQNELALCSEQLAQLEDELQSLKGNLFLLRRLAIEEMVLESAESLRLLRLEFNLDIIRPRVAARRAIDRLLKPYVADVQSYLAIQKIDRDLNQNRKAIQHILDSMKSSSDIRVANIYKLARSLKVVERMWDMFTTAHQYRSFRRQREYTDGPLGEASFLELFRSYGAFNPDSTAPEPSLKKTIKALVPDWNKPAKPKVSGKSSVDAPNKPLLLARLLWNFYVRRWEEPVPPPRSPLLNIFWRHIDIIAPIEIVLSHGQMLSHEIYLLIESLRYPLPNSWSRLSKSKQQRYSEAIRATTHNFDTSRVAMKMDYDAFRYVSWARLQTESRLHHLGIIAPTIQDGLFTPAHALSQDLSRFRDWVVTYTDCVLASAILNQLRALQGIMFWKYHLTHDRFLSAEARAHARHRLKRWIEKYFNALTPYTRKGTRRLARKRLLRFLRRDSKAFLIHKAKRNKGSSKTSTTKAKAGGKSKESVQADQPSNPVLKRDPSLSKPKATDVVQARTKREGRRRKAASSTSLNQRRKYSTRACAIEEQPASELPSAEPGAASKPGPLCTGRFWSHKLHKDPNGKDIVVHYCTSMETAERVASEFLSSEIVGFDIEWKAQSTGTGSITDNVSLIQLANEERIALFHLAVFRPGRTVDQLVPPSLRKVLESPDIIKAGVSIKADCTRLRRHLGINVRSQFELSHLYKLIKYAGSNPSLINRRAVNLSQQVEEHFGLPLDKDDDVRCGDWSQILTDDQIHCTCQPPSLSLKNLSSRLTSFLQMLPQILTRVFVSIQSWNPSARL